GLGHDSGSYGKEREKRCLLLRLLPANRPYIVDESPQLAQGGGRGDDAGGAAAVAVAQTAVRGVAQAVGGHGAVPGCRTRQTANVYLYLKSQKRLRFPFGCATGGGPAQPYPGR